MIFSSYMFIFIFLPIVWLGFHILKCLPFSKSYIFAKVFLVFGSLFFYAYWKLAYLPILLSSIVVNYILALGILSYGRKAINKVNISMGGGAEKPESRFSDTRF